MQIIIIQQLINNKKNKDKIMLKVMVLAKQLNLVTLAQEVYKAISLVATILKHPQEGKINQIHIRISPQKSINPNILQEIKWIQKFQAVEIHKKNNMQSSLS